MATHGDVDTPDIVPADLPLSATAGGSKRKSRRSQVTTAAARPVYNEQTFQDGFQPIMRKRRRIPMPKENPFDPRNCKPTSFKKTVRNVFRISKWLPKYFSSGAWKSKLPMDIAGGLTVGVMNIPQALAYANLANVPPVIGLYTSFIPVLIYLIFGSSHHIAVGTFAVVSLMVGQVVTDLSAVSSSSENLTNVTDFCGPPSSNISGCALNASLSEDDPALGPTPIQVAVTVSILVGLLQIGMSIVRLGVVTIFLSEAMISGYTTGAAFHVLTSQVRSMFGIKMESQKNPAAIIKTFVYIFSHIRCTNPAALVTGIICVVLLYFLKRISPKVQKKIRFPLPSELIILIVATLISYLGDFRENFDMDVVNCIPTGPPTAQFSSFGSLPWKDAIAPSVPIAIVAFSIAVGVGQGFAKKHEYTIDSNQELLALGLSNVVGGCFSCIVATASLSRSAVYEAVGARTQFGSLFGVIIIIFVIFLIGPLFQPLPKSVLAAIVMVSLKGLFMQFKELKRLWKISIADASVWFVTFLGTFLLGVDVGLGVGLGYSLVIVLFRTSRPYYCTLGQARGTDIYRDTNIYSDILLVPGVRIFRFESSLFFGNIQYFISCLHHCVNLDPASERRHLKRQSSRVGASAMLSPQGGRQTESDRVEYIKDEERRDQVSSLAYQSSLHTLARTCDEIATHRRTTSPTPDDYPSSDSDADMPQPVPTTVRYRRGATNRDSSTQEDTVHMVVPPTVSGFSPDNRTASDSAAAETGGGFRPTSPPGSPFRVASETEGLTHVPFDYADDISPAMAMLNDSEGIPPARQGTPPPPARLMSTTSLEDERVRFVIIDCSPVNYVDTQSVSALTALIADYSSVGVQLLLASCRFRVRQMLSDAGFIDNIGSDHLFVSVHDAVRYTQTSMFSTAVTPTPSDHAVALMSTSV